MPRIGSLVYAHAVQHASGGGDPVPYVRPYLFVFPGSDVQVSAPYNSPVEVASLTIPAQGWPYLLVYEGMIIVRTGSSANQRIDLSLRATSITGTEIMHATGTQVAGFTYQQPVVNGVWPKDGSKLSGEQVLKLGAGMFPSGTGLFLGGNTDPGHFLSILAIPA